MPRRRLRVTGIVQGVGFRPFVYRHATAQGLTGYVCNDSAGVLIEVNGPSPAVSAFERALRDDPPPLARITSIVAEPVNGTTVDPGTFHIVDSPNGGEPSVPVSVDSATCDACLTELFDASNRRFRYPFTNCTNCGPRYTIVRAIPYDRRTTTMACFTMCAQCQAEYDDPADRRFHAQPNACPKCGPQLTFDDVRGANALDAAVALLRAGGIVAVKGLGGYHLAVDATAVEGVAELRRRKARDDKPFAVMVRDLEEACAVCDLDAAANDALRSPRRPIVLAPRARSASIVDAVAPGMPELGLMLPYTPLHHLLLHDVDRPIVMTSGNLSDEPIAHDDGDALVRLAPLVDGILGHDRAIHIRCDDSVVRARGGEIRVLRRSRGYAPEPLSLPVAAKADVLAVGAELKNTIAIAKDTMAVASHHIGDLEHLSAYESFRQAVDHLQHLYGVTPAVIAHDLHPEYLSTKFVADLAVDLGIDTIAVQHHHAHVASCLVEHGRVDPVVALAFDGLGFGTDGVMWGGEVLVADLTACERVAHLPPVVMPGGVAAIREPRRMAVAWGLVEDVAIASVPGPATTSMGRLFDAVASVLIGRERVTYEAQAAIELEALARRVNRHDAPHYDADFLDPTGLLETVLDEKRRGVDLSRIAAGFHDAIGRAAASTATSVASDRGLDTVVLTGGVFQNQRLSEVIEDELRAEGLTVLTHATVPSNDGGISIGQAAIAAATL